MSMYTSFRNARYWNVPKRKVRFGPFVGGLNTEVDPSLISNNEAKTLVNYQVVPTGKLISRPSVTYQVAPVASAVGFTLYNVGEVLLNNGQNTYPLVARRNDSANTTTYYYYVPGTGWTQIWAVTSVFGPTKPRKYIYYGNTHYIIHDSGVHYFTGTSTGSAGTATGPTLDTANAEVLLDAYVLHQRLFLVGTSRIYWSAPGDFTYWSSTVNGAGLSGGSNSAITQGGGAVIRAIDFENSIFLFKQDTVWRLDPGLSDPSLGDFTPVVPDQGMWGGIVYNNQMYMANALGVYKWANGYLVELSGRIRREYRTNAADVKNWVASALFTTPTCMRLDNLLIVGPFNATAPIRDTSTPVKGAGAYYYVYNMDLDVWTTWSFNAYKSTNGISGPVNRISVAHTGTAASTAVWVGQYSDGAGALRNAVYLMDNTGNATGAPSESLSNTFTDPFTTPSLPSWTTKKNDNNNKTWTAGGGLAYLNYEIGASISIPIFTLTVNGIANPHVEMRKAVASATSRFFATINLTSPGNNPSAGTCTLFIFQFDMITKNGYGILFQFYSHTVSIVKITGSTFTVLSSRSIFSLAEGYYVELTYYRSTGFIKLFVDDTLTASTISATDTSYNSSSGFNTYGFTKPWHPTYGSPSRVSGFTMKEYVANSQSHYWADLGSGSIYEYIGHILETKTEDDGDALQYKRIFKTLVDADYRTSASGDPTASTSTLGLIIDGADMSTSPVDTGLLAIGRQFRTKEFSVKYDSLTNTPVDANKLTDIELDNIFRITSIVASAREVSV